MIIPCIRYYFLASFIMLFFCLSLPAQKKYEREYSLNRSSVPAPAIKFIGRIFANQKIHWYREESLTGTTIEAKLKHGGTRYSIEFTKEGLIQDVEILSSFKSIPTAVKRRIEDELKAGFKYFRIVKTQIQWSGTDAQLSQALITREELPQGITIRYELIIKGKKSISQKYFEVLCNYSGAIINTREIVQRNSDNLVY